MRHGFNEMPNWLARIRQSEQITQELLPQIGEPVVKDQVEIDPEPVKPEEQI